MKILDFGLARAAAGDDMQLTKTGTILGTPAYMAPEQARAEKVDSRCDLFSLGAVLYRVLTGTLPFKGKDTMSQLMSLATDTPRPVRELNPDVPPPLADLVTQLLAKAAAARPPSARAVVDALAAIEEGLGRPLDSAASKRSFTASERAVLEEPTRLIDSAEAPPIVQGGTPQPRWLVPLAACGGLLGLLALVLIFAWGSAKKPSGGHSSQEWQKDITNSIGMKLVRAEPGVFLMGSPENEAERGTDEHQHEVEITRPFYVGVYEVTQEQYERVMGANPSHFSSTGGDKDKVKGMDTRQFPVESVSWEDAVKFCGRLSELPEEKANGRLYRLPTEAEWEYVCRGGPFFKQPPPPFYFGNSLSATQANFDGNLPYGGAAKGAYLERTTKVGSYPANLLGLHDLHGNVLEWCADWYDAEYYKRRIRQDPPGPENGKRRVLRGGSWNYNGWLCRAAYRNYVAPGDRSYNVGFRVVLVAGART